MQKAAAILLLAFAAASQHAVFAISTVHDIGTAAALSLDSLRALESLSIIHAAGNAIALSGNRPSPNASYAPSIRKLASSKPVQDLANADIQTAPQPGVQDLANADIQIAPQHEMYEPVQDLANADIQTAPQPGVYEPASSCCSTEDDLETLFQDNLRPDIDAWTHTGSLSIADIETTIRNLPQNDVRRLVLIKDGRMYFVGQANDTSPIQPGRPLNRHLYNTWWAFRRWAKKGGKHKGMGLPDSLFVFNVHDFPACGFKRDPRLCAAPILSTIKSIGWPTAVLEQFKAAGKKPGGSSANRMDLLFPLPPESYGSPQFHQRAMALLSFTRELWLSSVSPESYGSPQFHQRAMALLSFTRELWLSSVSPESYGSPQFHQRAMALLSFTRGESSPTTALLCPLPPESYGSPQFHPQSYGSPQSHQESYGSPQFHQHLKIGSLIYEHLTIRSLINKHLKIGSLINKHLKMGSLINKHLKMGSLMKKHLKIGSLINKHLKIGSLINKHLKIGSLINKHLKIGSLINKHLKIGSLIKKHFKMGSLINKHLKMWSLINKHLKIGSLINKHLKIGSLINKHLKIGYLTNLTYYQGGYAQGLNTGLTSPSMDIQSDGSWKQHPSSGLPIPKAPSVSIPDHARFKYLLNLDGYTASYRLSKLLHVNSVVLKQDSFHGEYFYRSLKEGVHYLPFFRDQPDDVLDIIKSLEGKDESMKEIARNAYLCPKARMLYFRRLINEYNGMFTDMQEQIDNVYWPAVQAQLKATNTDSPKAYYSLTQEV
eukprot:gene23298-30534_t